MILSIVIFTVFTVSLTENLQIADGIGVTKAKLEAVMQPGQDRTMTWKIVNNSDEKIWVEVFAKGAGSEFLFFEEIIALEPRAVLVSEVIVAIPEDHPNNIEYRPQIFALQRGDPEAGKDGAATVTVNTQLRKTVTIKIGDNPIYTPPQEDIKSEAPAAVIIPEKEAAKVKTLEDKLKEIAEKNKQLVREEETVDDSFEESVEDIFEESIDEGYIPEPESEDKGELVKECNFFEIILSWFGIGKC